MFKCESCNQISESRRPSTKVVLEYREVEYPVYYFKKFKKNTRMIINKALTDEEIEAFKADKWIPDTYKIVKGREIVKEITVCEKCRASYEQK